MHDRQRCVTATVGMRVATSEYSENIPEHETAGTPAHGRQTSARTIAANIASNSMVVDVPDVPSTSTTIELDAIVPAIVRAELCLPCTGVPAAACSGILSESSVVPARMPAIARTESCQPCIGVPAAACSLMIGGLQIRMTRHHTNENNEAPNTITVNIFETTLVSRLGNVLDRLEITWTSGCVFSDSGRWYNGRFCFLRVSVFNRRLQ